MNGYRIHLFFIKQLRECALQLPYFVQVFRTVQSVTHLLYIYESFLLSWYVLTEALNNKRCHCCFHIIRSKNAQRF